MTHIRNAFDYHNELSELKAVINSIENTLEYLDSAFTHIDEADTGVIPMALSLAQADLKKSHKKLKDRHDDIINKLSSSYF